MNGQQLKNSILQMAVQGKLVPQDPNDEPASVLVAKIRKEKEKLVKEGKIKKDKNPSYIFRGTDNLPYEKVGNSEPVCIANQVPFEIPDSWEWTKIESISIPVGNKSNQILAKEILNQGKIPVVSQGKELIDGYCNNADKKINVLPLVMFGDHTRNVKYIDFEFVIGADGTKFHKIVICNAKYIFYWMSYAAETLRNRGYARHYSLLRKCYIPLPPLNEQARIIEMIERISPAVDKYELIDGLLSDLNSTFPGLLKKSILQEGIQGKLVPQDPNDEPASLLLERIREEKQRLIKEGKIKKDKHESIIFRRDNSYYEKLDGIERCIDDEIPFEIPDSWEWVRWGTLSESIQYGYNAPARDTGRIKMVRISDIQNNSVLWEKVPYCEINENDIDTYLLKSNDILFARTGGTVGKSYLVQDVPEEAIYAGYLIRTRYCNQLNPQYLKYFMESELYWSQLREGTIATAQPNCNGKTLGNMLVPLPPLFEQKRITKQINSLLSSLKTL
ncbi:restriction endonuclease subunit S [Faecalicoccus pleomorphus]|uniref:restriction endonuclease subunit S n=1 Tax=Faecalicoccus pleomorphus TaxID=1323 RepID=UPI0039F4DE73